MTADDVARALGLSQSTVSRAFSGAASVSAQTRERIVQAAAKLGYRPNAIARGLTTRRTGIIAVVIANLVDPLYPQVLDELTRAIQRRGRQTLLFIPPEEGRMDEIVASLLQYRVDGIVMTSATLTSAVARICAAQSTPVVLFNRYVPDLRVRAVVCDNVASGREVASFLISQGHRRLVFVPGQSDATTNLDRRSGFFAACEELGIEDVREVEGGAYSIEAGVRAAQTILALQPAADAVFFASDIMAIGGIQAFRKAGVRVPEDVSVIGFDDVSLASWSSFDLTTVRLPVSAMVEAALDGLDVPRSRGARTRFFPGELVIRGTTSCRS